MRQHMHIAKRTADQSVGSERVRQDRPIRTRNVAVSPRLVPIATKFLGRIRLAEAMDDQAVTAVERLLNRFGQRVPSTNGGDGGTVKLVIAGILDCRGP